MKTVRFGPAGNSDSFYNQGNKSTLQMPKWLFSMGLNAYEYQAGRGINISKATANKLGDAAKEFDIELSFHSPYFFNIASEDAQKRASAVDYIIKSLDIANTMGAKRVVVHSGSCARIDRQIALEYAKNTIKNSLEQAKTYGLSDVAICPETMGKINQLGTLEEVIEICKIDDSLIPTIDFGHLNARTNGGLKAFADFEDIFIKLINRLGIDRTRVFHSHFSKIEYTKGGEKRHLTFSDEIFGPDFLPVAELIYKYNCTPTLICESDGTMAEDALNMKKIYEGVIKE
jgi:deoxyribonuclease-4